MNKIDSLKKKIKYRSEYRGIKEMDLLLSNFVNKYIDSFNYEELINLYEILEKDDDIIFKWYSNKSIDDSIPNNKVSNLLKKFKVLSQGILAPNNLATYAADWIPSSWNP